MEAEEKQEILQHSDPKPELPKDRNDDPKPERGVRRLGEGRGRGSRHHIQPDIDYHTQLTDHIKHAFPNQAEVTPDLLRGLNIPPKIQPTSKSVKKPLEKKEGRV